MNPTPVLIGFIVGAIIGVLVTDLDQAGLQKQFQLAFSPDRIRRLFRIESLEYGRQSLIGQWAWFAYCLLSHLIRAAARALVVEWLLLLLPLWVILVPVLWFAAAHSHTTWLDPDWFSYVFIGSLVGFAAAPWVWLHFSRDLSSGTQKPPSAVEPHSAEDIPQNSVGQPGGDSEGRRTDADDLLNRYRFLTIALGILLVVCIFGPFLREFLSRSTKVEALGVSISLPDRASATEAVVIAPNLAGSPTSTASGKLAENTRLAMQVGNATNTATTLHDIGADLSGFDGLSFMDRDSGFVAYLKHTAHYEANPLDEREYQKLDEYISEADDLTTRRKVDLDINNDLYFIRDTARFYSCLNLYADAVHDIHLYFIDTSPFLEELVVQLISSESGQQPTSGSSLPVTLPYLARLMTDMQDRAFDVLNRSGINHNIAGRPLGNSCHPDMPEPYSEPYGSKTPANWYPLVWAPNGATPYPALLALYSLAAVDSPETGMLYLSRWIAATEEAELNREAAEALPLGNVRPTTSRIRWYLLRAKISLSQMAGTTLKGLMEYGRQVAFQRQITDELAELLNVRSTATWKLLCRRLARGDLHGRIGQRLAFIYATERNYLFELEEPALVDGWRQAGRTGLVGYLRDDLAEATALAALPECFAAYPNFEDNRRYWLGQFKINVAQLRIDLMPTLPASQVESEVKDVQHILDEATAELGQLQPPHREAAPIEQLMGSELFDDQRPRVQTLQSLVASYAKSR